jgi:hypothetical protein
MPEAKSTGVLPEATMTAGAKSIARRASSGLHPNIHNATRRAD